MAKATTKAAPQAAAKPAAKPAVKKAVAVPVKTAAKEVKPGASSLEKRALKKGPGPVPPLPVKGLLGKAKAAVSKVLKGKLK